LKSDYKYHNEAVKAFQSLDEALRPFVKQEMFAVYKERWLEYVAKQVRWERDEPTWDTLALLYTMRWQWPDVFKMKGLRGPEELGKVSALIEWRHRIQGHSSEPVAKEDAEAAINSMLHLLKRIGAATEVGEVEQLLLSFKPQPPLDVVKPPQDTQTEDKHSAQSSQITKQLAEGQEKLDAMVSSAGEPSATSVAGQVEETPPTIEQPMSYGKSMTDKLVSLGSPLDTARTLETAQNEEEVFERIQKQPHNFQYAMLNAILDDISYKPFGSEGMDETSGTASLAQKPASRIVVSDTGALPVASVANQAMTPQYPVVIRCEEQYVKNNNIEEAEIEDPVVLLRIDRSYIFGIMAEELYEATRGDWAITPEKRFIKPRYAMAVVSFIIREIYIIDAWHPVPASPWGPGRWQFNGTIASDKADFIGKSVQSYINRRSSNPVRYVNCG
jgi:hypothetical protein